MVIYVSFVFIESLTFSVGRITTLEKINTELKQEIEDIYDHIDSLINRYCSICLMLQDMRDNKSLLVYNIKEYDKQDLIEEYNTKLIKYMQDRAELRKQKN